MKRIVKKIFGLFGLSVSWKKTAPVNTSDISERKRKIFEECRPYTLISLERTDAIVSAVDYLCQNNIPGDIVECGVWKGGSVYAAVKTLSLNKSFNRKIYLFDVFDVNAMFSTNHEIAEDRDYRGITAADALEKGYLQKDNYNYQVDEVKALLKKTGYPMENIIFKIGRVENTLPCDEIENIALLRLDTDWYDSTKHELETLYPKLVKNGVLLIDDYGYWQGCKKAVDEYFSQNNIPMFLHRTDYTGRSAIKF
ncbi:MAG: class I SAM-dependent methyltransferase [Bacteroidetes bacterium]|nr:class I SAM-dependent methyltransferase [Bacteroidota bacterium]